MPTYICERCGYSTPRKADINRHNVKINVCPPDLEDIPRKFIKKPTEKVACQFCKRMFSATHINHHEKNLCNRKNIEEKEREIEELKMKLELEQTRKQPQQQTIVNNYIQVNINGYRQTSFEHLTDRHYQRAVHRMVNMVPQMIQDVHFNKKA